MPELLRPLDIGGVRLANNLVLSPMAGFSDLPHRVLCRRHGAGLVCSEMVSTVGVLRAVPETRLKMRTLDEETPMSIQLFGTVAEDVEQAARDLDARCAIVGFNMGCPAHQIKRQGCGAAMLDRPDLALEMVRAIKRGTTKPLLVKMRLGNGARIDSPRFARDLERAGADGLIVHGRTAAMGYSGRSDWDAIAAVKRAVGIPVIGNGDVADGRSAEAALRSGVDGVALGRATLGNPHVFAEVAAHLRGEPAAPQGPRGRLDDLRAYVAMAEAIGISLVQMREQAQQFSRGLVGGAQLRSAFNAEPTVSGMVRRFEAFVEAWEARGARVVPT